MYICTAKVKLRTFPPQKVIFNESKTKNMSRWSRLSLFIRSDHKCQLRFKFSAICQLSVFLHQLSVLQDWKRAIIVDNWFQFETSLLCGQSVADINSIRASMFLRFFRRGGGRILAICNKRIAGELRTRKSIHWQRRLCKRNLYDLGMLSSISTVAGCFA